MVGVILIIGIFTYLFYKNDSSQDNKIVTLCLSEKSRKLVSDMDDSIVDTMIKLFAE